MLLRRSGKAGLTSCPSTESSANNFSQEYILGMSFGPNLPAMLFPIRGATISERF